MASLVSVITVNYNGLELTCALIDSLRRHVTSPLEIIVVDNGSQCNEAIPIGRRHEGVTTLRSEINLGFAGGNNLGIKSAHGEYLWLLNNDTEVIDNSLEALIERLETNSTMGAVCPKIRFYEPPHRIQFAGYTPLTRTTLRNRLIGFGEEDCGRYDTPGHTPYMHGASVLVRRSAWERVGPMPEPYFLYYEELDWSMMFTRAGLVIGYEPRATILHKESSSTGRDSPLRTYYLTRNRLLFAKRNLKRGARCRSVGYQLCIALPKAVIIALLHGRHATAHAAIRGAQDFMNHKYGQR